MTKNLYDILGVAKDADAKEIKRAYYGLAKNLHPDKEGGDKERFQAIQKAYDILSDAGKREMYDMTGSTDEQGGPPPGHPFGGGMPFGFGGVPFDLGAMFGGMFGGGPGPRPARRQKQPKGPNKTHEIGLRLEDFYNGRRIGVEFERQAFCEVCKGEGVQSWNVCGECNGAGFREQHIMVGPGMVMVQKGPCGGCGGEGRKNGAKCGTCDGRKVMNQHKKLEIIVEPGARPGDVITFAKDCSDHPDFEEAGDVLIVLAEAVETTVFKREGDDLYTTVELGLADSLLGTTRTLPGHPGWRDGLVVKIPEGTQSGEILHLEGQGMPKKGVPGEKGVLHVTVKVRVGEEERAALIGGRVMLMGLFSRVA